MEKQENSIIINVPYASELDVDDRNHYSSDEIPRNESTITTSCSLI